MVEKTSSQLTQVITLLNELKSELQEVRTDIRSLKKQAGFGQRHPRRRAVITVPSCDDSSTESIELSAKDWGRVRRGETVKIRSDGYQLDEKTSYWNEWEFSGGVGGFVKLETRNRADENDLDIEFEGELAAEYIRELDEPSNKRR